MTTCILPASDADIDRSRTAAVRILNCVKLVIISNADMYSPISPTPRGPIHTEISFMRAMVHSIWTTCTDPNMPAALNARRVSP